MVGLWVRIVCWKCGWTEEGGELVGAGRGREERGRMGEWEWKRTRGNDWDKKGNGRGRETESAVEHHSCGEQADSAQQSKHTAGLPWEEASSGDAASLSLLVPPTMPASLPADSCIPVIYFSPPHLTGRLLPITQGRGSALTARAPGQSTGFPAWHPLLLDPAYRGSIPTSTFHCCDQLGSFQTWRLFAKSFQNIM